jgi:hypothetical protein
MAKQDRESLSKLKTLVEELSDRDEGLKRDASLFEAVFRDFPIPVTIWLTDEKGLCVSRKVSGRDSRGWSSPPPPMKQEESMGTKVIDMYQCVELKKEIERNLKIALKGKQLSFMSCVEGAYIWSRLTPRYFEDGTCSGVIGVSWDLTVNFRMFNTLLKISASDCCLGDPEMDLLKVEAKSAANQSVIKSLLEESGT